MKHTFKYVDLNDIEGNWGHLYRDVKFWIDEIRADRFDPFPSKVEELEAIRKANEGSTRHQSEVINRNLRFVVSLSRKYLMDGGVDTWDIISAGNLGLCNALEKFDPEYDVKFITYAVNHIRAAFIDELREAQAVKLSAKAIQFLKDYSIHGDVATMKEKLPNRYPQTEEAMETKLEDFLNIKFMNSLNIQDEEGNEPISNLKEVEDYQVDRFDIRGILDNADYLTKEETAILKVSFGINEEEKSLGIRGIAAETGMTTSKVAKMRRNALSKLRENSNEMQVLFDDLIENDNDITWAQPKNYQTPE